MIDWAPQGVMLLKLGLCGLPLGLALYMAEELAVRRDLPAWARLWRLPARAVLFLVALCLIGQLLVWAMG